MDALVLEPGRKKALTGRQRECMQWVAMGKSSWEIGLIIGASPHTVDFHVKRAMNKLGVTNRCYAVALCAQRGLVSVEDPNENVP